MPPFQTVWTLSQPASAVNQYKSIQYKSTKPTARTWLVSITDSEGIRHAVEVSAGTLYKAAALAIGEFRRCEFTTDAPGPAPRLTLSECARHDAGGSPQLDRGVAPERRQKPRPQQVTEQGQINQK